MRVVKLYEKFRFEKVEADISDMFLELKDKGLNYLVSGKYTTVNGGFAKEIDITIYRTSRIVIDFDWIKDPVDMARDYLEFSKELYTIGYNVVDIVNSPDRIIQKSNFKYYSYPEDFKSDVQVWLALGNYGENIRFEVDAIKIRFIDDSKV